MLGREPPGPEGVALPTSSARTESKPGSFANSWPGDQPSLAALAPSFKAPSILPVSRYVRPCRSRNFLNKSWLIRGNALQVVTESRAQRTLAELLLQGVIGVLAHQGELFIALVPNGANDMYRLLDILVPDVPSNIT